MSTRDDDDDDFDDRCDDIDDIDDDEAVVQPVKKKRSMSRKRADFDDDIDYDDKIDDNVDKINDNDDKIHDGGDAQVDNFQDDASKKRKNSVISDTNDVSRPTADEMKRIKRKYVNDHREPDSIPEDSRQLPPGFRHVCIKRVGNTARSIGMPYRPALIGSQEYRGEVSPRFLGVIVHEDCVDDLLKVVKYKAWKKTPDAHKRLSAHERRAAAATAERQRDHERQESLAGAYSSAQFEQKLVDNNLANVPSAVRAARLVAGSAANVVNSPAAIKVVDEAIAAVRERFDSLCALAARLDVRALPDEVDVTSALGGSAPLSSVLAHVCAAFASNNRANASWRTALAARCDPVASAIDDATIALLEAENASQNDVEEDDGAAAVSPVFGVDKMYRMAWLVGADDAAVGVERRLARLDATLCARGIVGELSPALMKERDKIASGRNEIVKRIEYELRLFNLSDLRERAREGGFNLRGATRKDDIMQRIVDAEADAHDADADVDELLASRWLQEEAAAHVELTTILADFHHEGLRAEVLNAWLTDRYRRWRRNGESPMTMRAIALRAIAQFRATMFRALASDIEILTWDGNTIRSDIARRTRASLIDVPVADGRMPAIVVGEAAARANAELATWKVVQDRLVLHRRERHAELVRQLVARGFVCESDFLVVNYYGNALEIDVRRVIAVEFSGRDPPAPIAVTIEGRMVTMDRGRGRAPSVREVREISNLSPQVVSFADVVRRPPVWRAQTLSNGRAVLRWPPRLYHDDASKLTHIVENADAPLRLPVELEMRAARRATLLAAIRAHGFHDKRVPLSVTSVAEMPIFQYLCKAQWPRPRALAAAFVGDVRASMQRDIFAALPQLVIAIICDHLHADKNAFQAAIQVSDAFALGASIWTLQRKVK